MNISDDIEVYKLSKLLQEFSDEKNSSFLYEYWVKSNKLKYLPKFLGLSQASVSPDEVQYVIALESLLESLIETLNSFIIDRYCSSVDLRPDVDASTIQQCDDLIVELENFQGIPFDSSWNVLYEKMSIAVAQITVKIDRLISVYSTGKQFHFVTNVEPADFVSTEPVNLKRKTGKYFIIDKQG